MKPPVVKVPTGASAVNAASMTERLTRLSDNILAAPAPSTTGAATTLQVLKQSALRSLAKKDKALASKLASIKTQATSALKDAKARQTACRKALASMVESAKDLLKP
jgi:septal ring factor EnvC (AmiA/AmiB activator)